MNDFEKTEALSKLISEGRMFNANQWSGSIKQNEPKEEFAEDGKRTEVAKLAETQTSDAQEQNPSIIKSNAAINSFKSMKEHLLNDSSVDSETIINLTRIEDYLSQLLSKQISKVSNQSKHI